MFDKNVSRPLIERTSRDLSKCVGYGADKVLCRVLGAMKMFASARDVTLGPHLAFDGFWESWVTVAFMKMLEPGMTVVNVGANIGYYTLIAASMVGHTGKVYAFEPCKGNFELLNANVGVNGYTDRVKTFECAVSDTNGKAPLMICPSHPMNCTLLGSPGSGYTSEEVEICRIDSKIKTRFDILFCDSEGSEPAVLEGLGRLIEKRPTLVLEWSPPRYSDPKASARWVLERGYKASKIGYDGSLLALRSAEFEETTEEIMVVCSPT